MNLNDAQILAELHMEAHGLIEKGWRFAFNRAKRGFGKCNFVKKQISLSRALVELNPEVVVEQTILHEVAHAIVGANHGHDYVWKRQAIQLGHSGSRCYDSSEVIAPPRDEARWCLVCPACGSRKPRRNKTKTTYSCGRCSPRFNRNFIMTWERN